MKIEMPFEFGDKLYWVNLLNADVDAKTILAEIRDDGGIINGVYLSDDGHVEVRHHYGTYDVFGSQYAFLSKEEATAWLNANSSPFRAVLTDSPTCLLAAFRQRAST